MQRYALISYFASCNDRSTVAANMVIDVEPFDGLMAGGNHVQGGTFVLSSATEITQEQYQRRKDAGDKRRSVWV